MEFEPEFYCPKYLNEEFINVLCRNRDLAPFTDTYKDCSINACTKRGLYASRYGNVRSRDTKESSAYRRFTYDDLQFVSAVYSLFLEHALILIAM